MYDMNDENIKLMAVSTLTSIWQCIDWDKVTGKRAMGIWDEFTSKVKSAAMTTNDYDAFVIKLCLNLCGDISFPLSKSLALSFKVLIKFCAIILFPLLLINNRLVSFLVLSVIFFLFFNI